MAYMHVFMPTKTWNIMNEHLYERRNSTNFNVFKSTYIRTTEFEQMTEYLRFEAEHENYLLSHCIASEDRRKLFFTFLVCVNGPYIGSPTIIRHYRGIVVIMTERHILSLIRWACHFAKRFQHHSGLSDSCNRHRHGILRLQKDKQCAHPARWWRWLWQRENESTILIMFVDTDCRYPNFIFVERICVCVTRIDSSTFCCYVLRWKYTVMVTSISFHFATCTSAKRHFTISTWFLALFCVMLRECASSLRVTPTNHPKLKIEISIIYYMSVEVFYVFNWAQSTC